MVVGVLVVAALIVARQFWGAANSRSTDTTEPEDVARQVGSRVIWTSGDASVDQPVEVVWQWTRTYQAIETAAGFIRAGDEVNVTGSWQGQASAIAVQAEREEDFWTNGARVMRTSGGQTSQVEWVRGIGPTMGRRLVPGMGAMSMSLRVVSVRVNGQSQPIPTTGQPGARTGGRVPSLPADAADPAANEPARRSVPAPAAAAAPAAFFAAPLPSTPPVPDRALPAVAPAPTLPPARPAGSPAGAVTVTRAGALPAVAPAPAPLTPPGAKVISTPRGPVTITPVPVPPTMAGIAEEVGRIETKTRVLMERQEQGGGGSDDLLDRLRDLLNRDQLREDLRELLDRQTADVPGGVYRVRPPCGRGPGGAPLPPVEVPVPPMPDVFAAIMARLDALAALVDEQKQLRGPVCKGKPGGEPVTITFEQVG